MAAGTKTVRSRGFTLVELLVVMVVMALVSGILLTSLPQRKSEAQRAALTLSELTQRLSDQAVIEGRAYGMDVTEGTLLLYRYAQGGWQRRPVPGEARLDDEIFLTLMAGEEFDLPDEEESGELLFRNRNGEAQSRTEKIRPAVIFNPAGDQTPFKLRVSDRENAYLLEVTALNSREVHHASE
ncbi:type II secretion system minor pseudopilin GspH [Parvularcula marina]|uniref:type II secretion system minor pseudopilin GspH n=1 Tax=Parvularcula marina TaxID=2292771 RepID=UPI0035179BB6